MMPIWIVYTEVRPQPGFHFGPDEDGVTHISAGAYVECFVPAKKIEVAIQGAKDALSTEGYDVVEIDRCIRFEPEEWDDDNDPESEARDAARSASSGSKTVFGPFRMFPEREA